jgi:hypothetical protein
MVDPNSFNDAVALQLAAVNSEPYKIQSELSELLVSYYTFDKNHHELRNLLSAAQDPEAFYDLWVMDKQKEQEEVMREVSRLLHNFLSSAMTLVAHTRNTLRRLYGDTEFWTEYQDEVRKRFSENTLHHFIQELRNYSLHYRLPLAAARVSLVQHAEPDMAYLLERDELLGQSFDWKKAMGFLEEAEEEIILKKVIDEYHAEARDFRVWLERRIEAIHSEEFAWLSQMHKRHQELLEPMRRKRRQMMGK